MRRQHLSYQERDAGAAGGFPDLADELASVLRDAHQTGRAE
ncbi:MULTISPECIES: hypothetical protein [unclassified Nonomuraea]